eukprot:m.26264 g.26264  ORF g.26264 m.26264 type:complete len:432 (-) comp8166_c0_seq1:101-1396(-)
MPVAMEDVEEAPEQTELDVIEALEIADPDQAIQRYLSIVGKDVPEGERDVAVKEKETAITRVSDLYVKHNKQEDLAALIKNIRPFLSLASKAKGGQIFKGLLDKFLTFETDRAAQVAVCTECIEWAKQQKRTFLRHALEMRMAQLYLDSTDFQLSLQTAQPLIKELKSLDDKSSLVDIQLLESKAYYALSNFPKSRAALVSARTTSAAIYCPPKMQAALDLQSGILNAQEGDFKTAYSYFYESFEGYDSVDMPEHAIRGLKYMLLNKILLNNAEDVPSIISGKLALKYTGRDVEALQAIATASLNRSLAEFQAALEKFKKELLGDAVINGHLVELYDTLLQKNLARVVEPFRRVEIAHVAKLIDLPLAQVENKLSQMILDQVLTGILDQGAGCLEVFDPTETDKTYETTLEILQETGHVVDSLYKKAEKLL